MTTWVDELWNEVNLVKKTANSSPNKSLLLTYVSAMELRLNQLIQKSFIAGEDSQLLSSKSGNSLDFYQKIELAYRTGLISNKMKEILNALRDLRNGLAHNEQDLNLLDGGVSSKIVQLYQGFTEDTRKAFPATTTKDMLEEVCSLMISELITRRNFIEPSDSPKDELPFDYQAKRPKPKPPTK